MSTRGFREIRDITPPLMENQMDKKVEAGFSWWLPWVRIS